MDMQKIKDRLNDNREEIRQRMVRAAKQKTTVTYTELFSPYGLDMAYDAHRNFAGSFLGEISEAEHAAGRHLLSVVVVHADDNKPGDGFFSLAEYLGFSVNKQSSPIKKDEFFIEQLNLIYAYWAEN